MNLDKAIEILKKEYEKALKQERIHKPLAYAFFNTWRKVDMEEKKRSDNNAEK